MAKISLPKEKIKISRVRCAFVNITKAVAFKEGDTPKFSITVLFDKDDPKQMAQQRAIEKRINRLITQAWGKSPRNPHNPMIDGDDYVDSKGDNPAWCENKYFLRLASTMAPKCVKHDGSLKPFDASKIFSGDWVSVSGVMSAFQNGKNLGITCYLNNILHVKSDPFLGSDPNKDFEDEEFEDEDDEDDELDDEDIPF